MRGLMQDYPLTLVHLFDRAERLFPSRSITTVTGTGERERTTYGQWAVRTRKVGGVLDALGISADGRVATSGGTAPVTWSSTSLPRARVGSCTR